MKRILVTALALLSVQLTHAQEKQQTAKQNEFSVKQAVDYGLQNSITVKNALLDIQEQKQTNREFTSAALPQLSASGSGTHYFDIPVQPIRDFIQPLVYGVLTDNNVQNGTTGQPITSPNNFPDLQFGFVQPWTASASIDIQQLLFDGQVFVGLQARSAVLKLATQTAEVTKEQIKANIYKIYYQLVVAKVQSTTIDANIERFEKLLADTKEIFKNGFAEKLDVDKVQVQLNNLKTEKQKLENQILVGNAGLKFLMNMPQQETLVLTDTLSDADVKSDILNTQFDYKDRKEFQVLTTAITLGGYNVRRYKLSRFPTLAAFGSYAKNGYGDKFKTLTESKWLTTSLVGLKLSIPLFDGFARSARISKANLELQKTKNNMEQLKQSIELDVSVSRTNITSAILTMDNQKKNMELAEQVYHTTKLKYEQGLGSNQEIYNAQTELKVSQNNYYSALYDAIIAKIDFLKATGKL